jgi:phospholipid transport system substrate-binding protein
LRHEPRTRSAHRFFALSGLDCALTTQLATQEVPDATCRPRSPHRKGAPFRQRYDKIAPVIGRTFDLEVIVRQVVGPRWAALPPDQQAALGDAFRRYTIASYVSNFDDYSGERFEVLPGVAAVGSNRLVNTQIVTASGQAHVLAYVIRQTDVGWRIVDVLADGSISRVAAQRSEIRSILSDGGGIGLVVNLRRKTAELSGGILE